MMLCAMELSACRKLVMTLRGINWLLMICVVSLRQRAQPSSGWMQEAVPLDSIGPLRSSSRAGTDLHTTYNPPNRANTLEHANTIQHTHITPHHTITLYHPISESKHTETRRRPNNLLQLQTPQGTMCVQDNVPLCVWWWYMRGNVLVCLDGA